jgi:hypothetical protein
MSPPRKRSLSIITGFLLILLLLLMEMLGGESIGLGKTLGSALADLVGLHSLMYYEGGPYEGALYLRQDAQSFHKVFAVNPLIPPSCCAAVAIAILIIFFVVVFQLHKFMAAATNGAHPVTAAKAVWAHLIPIYSFYWVFGWTNRAAEFVSLRNTDSPMRKGWPGLALLLGFLVVYADVVTGMSVVMLALAHIRARVVSVSL